MPNPIVFMMGRSPAFLPVDRRYTTTHYWATESTDGAIRIGLTAYAVKLLGEIHALRWNVATSEAVAAGSPIGHVEASKAVSDLFAPIDGVVLRCNDGVTAAPSLINTNLYDDAWLLEIRPTDGAAPTLLSPEDYASHLEKVWPIAQRMLKGQLGRAGDEEKPE